MLFFPIFTMIWLFCNISCFTFSQPIPCNPSLMYQKMPLFFLIFAKILMFLQYQQFYFLLTYTLKLFQVQKNAINFPNFAICVIYFFSYLETSPSTKNAVIFAMISLYLQYRLCTLSLYLKTHPLHQKCCYFLNFCKDLIIFAMSGVLLFIYFITYLQ